jgi:hypothetical protein
MYGSRTTEAKRVQRSEKDGVNSAVTISIGMSTESAARVAMAGEFGNEMSQQHTSNRYLCHQRTTVRNQITAQQEPGRLGNRKGH